MKCFGLAILGVLVGLAFSPWAQDAPPIDATGYENPGQIYSGATGLIGVPTAPVTPGWDNAFEGGVPTLPEQQSKQGIGGFGYYDYSNALFSMPEVYSQFINRDVNSELARSLMVQNMTMPQTAALFGQLNTFGAERYQQFLASFPLGVEQREARDKFLQACLIEVRAELGYGADATAAAKNNAQAAETCLQRYTARTRAIQTQNEQTYSEFLRQAQDVNGMIAPLLCPPSGTTTVGAATACWPNLLLKQVRLCSTEKLDATGNPEYCDPNAFGENPAPVPLQTLLDIMVTTVGHTYLVSITNPFLRQLAIVDGATLRNSAQRAKMEIPNQPSPTVTNSVAGFQTNYLQCANSNPMVGLRALGQVVYNDVFGSRTDGGTSLPNGRNLDQERQASLLLSDTGLRPFQRATENLLTNYHGLPEEEVNRLEIIMSSAMHAAVGCAINRDIPFLDPNTIITMRNSCSPDDLQSYFQLAAMDVANVAARNMLLYTKQQLEGALGRLEADDPTALRTTTTDTNGATTSVPFDSPAVRLRLARAVRQIMLPQLESDLKRLDMIDDLAKKSTIRKVTQGIYKSSSGCLSTRSGPQ